MLSNEVDVLLEGNTMSVTVVFGSTCLVLTIGLLLGSEDDAITVVCVLPILEVPSKSLRVVEFKAGFASAYLESSKTWSLNSPCA